MSIKIQTDTDSIDIDLEDLQNCLEEREYCKLLRYCEKMDKLEKKKEIE